MLHAHLQSPAETVKRREAKTFCCDDFSVPKLCSTEARIKIPELSCACFTLSCTFPGVTEHIVRAVNNADCEPHGSDLNEPGIIRTNLHEHMRGRKIGPKIDITVNQISVVFDGLSAAQRSSQA